MRLQIVDPVTFTPIPHISLGIDGSSQSSGCFTISGPAGPFHTLKCTITFKMPLPPTLKQFSVLLSVPCSTSPPVDLSATSSRMRAIIGETDQNPLESWDNQNSVLMRALSGVVEIRMGQKGSEATASAEKGEWLLLSPTAVPFADALLPWTVQTIHRHIHVPPVPDLPRPSPPLVVVERPGLNNSTGQRLWDCAIGISCWLTLNPHILHGSVTSTHLLADTVDILEPPSKRARSSPRAPKRVFIELGAGSGLASLMVARLLGHSTSMAHRVIATDVEVTVSSTLTENLNANPRGRAPIDKQVLDWGPISSNRMQELRGDDDSALTLLGADILYNPESHAVLLESMLALLRPPRNGVEGDEAFIAYKARTEGDNAFFELGRTAGLKVNRVWEWGDVSIWSFAR